MSAPDRALLIAVEEYDDRSNLSPLSGTIDQINELSRWLVGKGVKPDRVVSCMSPPAPGTHPATFTGIADAAEALLDLPGDPDELVLVYIVGHGFDLVDRTGRRQGTALYTADYAGQATGRMLIDDLVGGIQLYLEARGLLVAINLCRLPTDVKTTAIELQTRNFAPQRARRFSVHSTKHGLPALRVNNFGTGLREALDGRGRAKRPTGTGAVYEVAFNDLVDYVAAIKGLADVEADPPACDDRLVLVDIVEPTTCRVVVRGARLSDEFRLGFRTPRLSQEVTFHGPVAEVQLLPEIAQPTLKRVEPPGSAFSEGFVDAYSSCSISFRQDPSGYLHDDPPEDADASNRVPPSHNNRSIANRDSSQDPASPMLIEKLAELITLPMLRRNGRPFGPGIVVVTQDGVHQSGINEPSWPWSSVDALRWNSRAKRIRSEGITYLPAPRGVQLVDIDVAKFSGLVAVSVNSLAVVAIGNTSRHIYQFSIPSNDESNAWRGSDLPELIETVGGPVAFIREACELQDRFRRGDSLSAGAGDHLFHALLRGDYIDPVLSLIVAWGLVRAGDIGAAATLTRRLAEFRLAAGRDLSFDPTPQTPSVVDPDLLALFRRQDSPYDLRELSTYRDDDIRIPTVSDAVMSAWNSAEASRLAARAVGLTRSTLVLDRSACWTVFHRVESATVR